MRSAEQLQAEVTEIVAEVAEVGVEEVAPDAVLEDLGVDSLGGLRIVAAVEKKYGLIISEQEIGKIRTMPDILSLVERHSSEVE